VSQINHYMLSVIVLNVVVLSVVVPDFCQPSINVLFIV
jgi:hypothetical protein